MPITTASTGTGSIGGPFKLDDNAAPDDNTDLNASTSNHGLLPKLNNSATQFLNGQGAWATPDFASGVYTPTLTGVANVDSSVAIECQYARVGATVMVAGSLSVDPTTTATLTRVGITLPVASDLGAASDLTGTAACVSTIEAGAIIGDATNNRAELNFIATSTASITLYFTFGYQVI